MTPISLISDALNIPASATRVILSDGPEILKNTCINTSQLLAETFNVDENATCLITESAISLSPADVEAALDARGYCLTMQEEIYNNLDIPLLVQAFTADNPEKPLIAVYAKTEDGLSAPIFGQFEEGADPLQASKIEWVARAKDVTNREAVNFCNIFNDMVKDPEKFEKHAYAAILRETAKRVANHYEVEEIVRIFAR